LTKDITDVLASVKQGEPPSDAGILRELSVGIAPLADFLASHYLDGFVSKGGSKIKFVTGNPGSGKTHFIRYLSAKASEMGYITVECSAREMWMHDFSEIYMEVFKKADLYALLEKCSQRVIREMGTDPSAIPEGVTFADYLSSEGSFDALTKKEIRNQLHELFLKNPLIDNNFAIACGLLTGGILGHPQLETSNRDLLLSWLSGSKDVKMATFRSLGFSPGRITKFNARHMLRSLAEISRLAGYPGIAVFMDDLDILARTKPLDTIRYTRLKRDDAYESIRELIDEIDSLKNILFVFAFDKILIDDETAGLKSYQALWMRIQNEIISKRFNKFTDIIDMDKYAEVYYGKDELLEMSRRLAEWYNRFDNDAHAIDGTRAEDIISKARFGKNSLPRQVNNATLQGEAHNG
jgi:Cdc6-like AAA superfamily ATPase